MVGLVGYDQPALSHQRIACRKTDQCVHAGDGDTRTMVHMIVQALRNVPPGTLAPQRRLPNDTMAHAVPCQCQRLAGRKCGTMLDEDSGGLLRLQEMCVHYLLTRNARQHPKHVTRAVLPRMRDTGG